MDKYNFLALYDEICIVHQRTLNLNLAIPPLVSADHRELAIQLANFCFTRHGPKIRQSAVVQ